MMFSRQRQFLTRHHLTITIGLAVGILGLIVSFSGKEMALGRAWGDPLPVMLAVSQLFRNPIYVNWRGVLIHVGFAAALGIFSSVLLVWQTRNGRQSATTTRAGQLAAIINIGAVTLTEVDAPMVAIWYLTGGYVSMLITTLTGQITVSLLSRLGSK